MREETEEAFLEAQEFAAIGEDVGHWEYLFDYAAWERREDICEFFLAHGIPGEPYLHALAYGEAQVELRLRLIKLFHRYGVLVPHDRQASGDTSVHHAAWSGQLEILRYLVEEMEGRWAFSWTTSSGTPGTRDRPGPITLAAGLVPIPRSGL